MRILVIEDNRDILANVTGAISAASTQALAAYRSCATAKPAAEAAEGAKASTDEKADEKTSTAIQLANAIVLAIMPLTFSTNGVSPAPLIALTNTINVASSRL